ncbi:MAG TPA: Flp family type IVb pilin [Stellaceae bacterium]|nr:Flp family type IVb pilin [Stellaceae bacterium]
MMFRLLRRFRRDESGVSSIEYAMLAVGIALAIFAGAKFLGNNINNALSTIGTSVNSEV